MIESQFLPADEANERLLRAARETASLELVPRPTSSNTFFLRIHTAQGALRRLEKEIERTRVSSLQEGPRQAAIAELRANHRHLRSTIVAMQAIRHKATLFPRLRLNAHAEVPRIAVVAERYLGVVGSAFSAPSFCSFVGALQSYETFTVNELWGISTFLRFALLEKVLDAADTLLHATNSDSIPLLTTACSSMRAIVNADWVFLIEPLIVFDGILRQDPVSAYARMDFESREQYRKRVAYIARHSDCTESRVAEEALQLARKGGDDFTGDPRIQSRRTHVGYYLLDEGFRQLADRVGFHSSVSWRMREFVHAHGSDFYIDGALLCTIFVVAAAFFPVLAHFSSIASVLTAIVFLCMPAMQDAVDLVNNAVTAFFDPAPLPKLDFSDGIPTECATLVAVPSLLLNEKQVHKLVNDLEVRYLANRTSNLHFALLTDLPDSMSKPHDRDSNPFVELAVRLVDGLNAKYGPGANGPFLLLHRHRIFNVRQGVWMGWERKRGKLLDLNKLLTGEYDAFPIKTGNLDVLRQVRYILTLDADTQLPPGAAARLAGTIAHPLNQAVIDPKQRIVTAGYGILQPRISITVQSTARSRLAAIYSGQNGFDIYTRASSDAYQDLFGEGIFTGKGIYEVATLHAVLNARFPRNALLSHDLIEGAYARAGLATDVELIEDYPSHYSAYSRRQHRWVRGDWQIAQWMFARVPDESGKSIANPISDINRWKIFDNLRRSLVDPFLFLLFVAGWLGLPGGPLYWTIVPILMLIFPTIVQLGFGVGRSFFSERKGGTSEAVSAFWHGLLIALLHLALLPHKMLLVFDAVIRSMIRRLITGKLLLEWETAAQAESNAAGRASVDHYLLFTPLIAIGIAAAVWFFAPHANAILCASPILVLWLFGGVIASWLNRPPRRREVLATADQELLLVHALRIWRYFHQFSTEKHNYLIPDNVEEKGLVEAERVSPTNVGLLLNARQAAYELGFLTAPEFADLTKRSMASIARLEKFRGHLYNWYDTTTLKSLTDSPFVSSVDSGNFVASLYTLHTGALDIARRPLFSQRLFTGLHAHWRTMLAEAGSHAGLRKLALPGTTATLTEWIEWLPVAEAALAAAAASPSPKMKDGWWIVETRNRITQLLAMIREYMPWMLPEYKSLRELPDLGLDGRDGLYSMDDAILLAEALNIRLAQARDKLSLTPALSDLSEKLHSSVIAAIVKLRTLENDLRALAQEALRLAQETEFAFLVDRGRQILSIGYDVGAQKLHEACYDMIASEARMATFLAIARGDLLCRSWGRLARDHVRAFGRFLLFSWSGTMFEYLMPGLWMRSYAGTLIANTEDAVVHVQRSFASERRLPWGISESGGATRNEAGHYHYQAYGIPEISLWNEATAGPVVSPYSTYLALAVNARAALRNLRRMASLKWTGAYGFYESADYTASRRTPVLVREWMAHHQGMSLLAIVNVLHDNIVQQWFHANPLVQGMELLLHETQASKAVLKARIKELAPLRIKQ